MNGRNALTGLVKCDVHLTAVRPFLSSALQRISINYLSD
jgi:hypothetical protein